MNYTIYIRNLDTYNNLKHNNKKYELRIYKGIFTKLKKNHIINIKYKQNVIQKRIKNIYLFNNFKELFNNLELNLCLPNIDDKNDALKYMKTFYSSNKINNYKIIALELLDFTPNF